MVECGNCVSRSSTTLKQVNQNRVLHFDIRKVFQVSTQADCVISQVSRLFQFTTQFKLQSSGTSWLLKAHIIT